MNKKIISVDFDGTLDYSGFPNIGEPNMELINFIKENKDKYTFILNTCRQGVYLQQAVAYLKDLYGVEFDYVNENAQELIDQYTDCRKIAADYYIDDRNLTLDNWKEVLNGREELQDNN